MSKTLERFQRMLTVRIPNEVTLSVLMRVGGCRWPILMRAVWMGTACWTLGKIAPALASAAEDMKVRMV